MQRYGTGTGQHTGTLNGFAIYVRHAFAIDFSHNPNQLLFLLPRIFQKTQATTMEKLQEQQHQQEGTDNLSMDQLKDALGGVLSFIKAKMEGFHGFDFSKIKEAVPEADELVAKAETDHASNQAAGGGASNFLTGAMGMFEKATQGSRDAPAGDAAAAAPAAAAPGAAPPIDSLTELLGYLTKAGIDPKQIMSFLPLVAGFLKDHAGVDVSSALGTPAAAPAPAAAPVEGGAAAAPAPAAAGNDAMGNLMNQASGFMSSFSKK